MDYLKNGCRALEQAASAFRFAGRPNPAIICENTLRTLRGEPNTDEQLAEVHAAIRLMGLKYPAHPNRPNPPNLRRE